MNADSMKLTVSSQLFYPKRFAFPHAAQVREQGIEQLELYALPPHFDAGDLTRVEKAGEDLHRAGVRVAAIHAPFSDNLPGSGTMSIGDAKKKRRAKAVASVKDCITAAKILHCDTVVIHFDAANCADETEGSSHIVSSMIDLADFIEKKKVRLAFENLGGTLGTTEYILGFMERYHFHKFGLCVDVGHANLSDNPVHSIEIAGKRLFHLHFSDNDGASDLHRLPMDGKIAWNRVMAALRRVKYKGAIVFECRGASAASLQLKEIAERWRILQELKEEEVDA